MQYELRAQVPKIDPTFARTLINRGWKTVREANLWSFQLFEGQWIAPPQYVGASCTVTQGSATVTLSTADSTNLAAFLVGQNYSLITQRQFRVGASGIYNIWGYTPGTNATLTLDRWYGEPSSTSIGFRIYQSYYVPQAFNAALPDFRSWLTVRDIQNFRTLFVTRYNRRDLDVQDPQRTWFGIPTDVVPYQIDQNPNSASYRLFMYELWGAPTYSWNYQLLGIRKGLDLVNPTDTLPPQVTQETVIAYAKYFAYQWAEANKDMSPRSSGPDWKFLMGAAQKEGQELMKRDRRADRETVDNWFLEHRLGRVWPEAHYTTQSGYANPGGGYG